MLTSALPAVDAQRDRVKQQWTVIWTSPLRFCFIFFTPGTKNTNTLFNSDTWQDDRLCVDEHLQAKPNVYSQQTDGGFSHNNVCPQDQQMYSTSFWPLW